MDIQEIDDIDISEEDIIADLLEAYPVLKPQPESGWIDKKFASKIWRVHIETAKQRLEKLEEEGKFESREFISPNGRRVLCYRKIR